MFSYMVPCLVITYLRNVDIIIMYQEWPSEVQALQFLTDISSPEQAASDLNFFQRLRLASIGTIAVGVKMKAKVHDHAYSHAFKHNSQQHAHGSIFEMQLLRELTSV